jgi:hypothetical protein
MSHLRKLGLASFLFLGLGLFFGAFGVRGLAAAGSTTLICYAVGLVLGLIAFMRSRRGQSLDGTTKFRARAPLAIVTIGVLIVFLRAMTVCSSAAAWSTVSVGCPHYARILIGLARLPGIRNHLQTAPIVATRCIVSRLR